MSIPGLQGELTPFTHRWVPIYRARSRLPAQESAPQAARKRVDPQALEQARADLGVVTSRSNAGGVMAVQWSLPSLTAAA